MLHCLVSTMVAPCSFAMCDSIHLRVHVGGSDAVLACLPGVGARRWMRRREGGGGVGEEMWLYSRETEGRRGFWMFPAERFREVAAREQNGKLRSPSLGLHNLQANDKTGYCVIKQFLIFHRLPMVFRGSVNPNEEMSTVYVCNKKAIRFFLLGRF